MRRIIVPAGRSRRQNMEGRLGIMGPREPIISISSPFHPSAIRSGEVRWDVGGVMDNCVVIISCCLWLLKRARPSSSSELEGTEDASSRKAWPNPVDANVDVVLIPFQLTRHGHTHALV